MQVVINRNSGGYTITDAALLEIYRLNPRSTAIKVVRPEDVGHDLSFEEVLAVKAADGNYVQAASDSSLARSCPAFVSVVRRLGLDAAEKPARLDVIESPDYLAAYSGLAGDDVLLSRRIRTYV